MSEEEIIKDLTKYISFANKSENFSNDNDFKWNTELSQRVQGLLDLYNKEKNKNRKLDRENQALYESINCDDNTMLARLYQEEKEKNKELFLQYEKEVDKLEYQITTMISKDKIREKIEELKNSSTYGYVGEEWNDRDVTELLEELLQEGDK